MKEYVDGDPDKQYDKLRRGRPIQERLAKELHRQAGEKEGPCGIDEPWIIERLDRKLADAIGSNIVEKCDVTLSRAIQPHSTFCAFYVSSHISLSLSSTIHIGHVLK